MLVCLIRGGIALSKKNRIGSVLEKALANKHN